MSTATTEKPVSPLGSFLTKLTPAPVEKVVEKVVEGKTEVTEAPIAAALTNATVVAPPESLAAKDTAKVARTLDEKSDGKPKEDVVDKRLKDTQKWGNEEHKARLAAEQKALDLQARLERIEKKLDGTY
jgi:hypothetical protein